MAKEYLTIDGKLMSVDGKLVQVPDPENINDLADSNVSYATLMSDTVDNVEDLLINGVIDGSPKGVYDNLSALQTELPDGASGVYVTRDNGHWYFWNDTEWVDSGAYRSDEDYNTLKSDVDNLNNNVDTLDKRVINIEANLSGRTFNEVLDTDLAYTKTVPAGALPYASIDTLGGMSYKYNEDIIHSNVTSIDSIGVNIWDEEWEVGSFNWTTGEKVPMQGRCRSKNLIRVFPNTEYYVGTVVISALSYDDNGNFIKELSKPNYIITTPINCSFIHICWNGTTYNHDICINVSNDAINGTYFPYKHNNYPIPSSIQALDGYGWGVNGSCYNYVDFENKKFVKKVGRVDLGTLDWKYNSSGFFYALLGDHKKANSTSTLANLLCSIYTNVSQSIWNNSDKNIWDFTSSSDKNICVTDSSYTDVASFKTAMSGVYLYYELATPVITDLSNILTDDNFIEVEANGTLTFENTNKKAVPSKIAYLVEV